MIITEFRVDTKPSRVLLEVQSKKKEIVAILMSLDKAGHVMEKYYLDGDGSKEVERSAFNESFRNGFTEKERDAFLKLTNGIYKTHRSEFVED